MRYFHPLRQPPLPAPPRVCEAGGISHGASRDRLKALGRLTALCTLGQSRGASFGKRECPLRLPGSWLTAPGVPGRQWEGAWGMRFCLDPIPGEQRLLPAAGALLMLKAASRQQLMRPDNRELRGAGGWQGPP